VALSAQILTAMPPSVRRTSAFASYGPKTAILLSADAVEKALDERREH
jgi:hypothetical protein